MSVRACYSLDSFPISAHTANAPLRDALWAAVDGLNWEHFRAFLKFVTGTERIPLPRTESIKIDTPFVAFGADEEALLFQTLPQSHTCDNVLEIPNYWRALLATERAARIAAAIDAKAAADAAAAVAKAQAAEAAEAAAAAVTSEDGDDGSSAALAQLETSSTLAAGMSPGETATEEEESAELAFDVAPTEAQRLVLCEHVRGKLIVAITMTASYGLDDA